MGEMEELTTMTNKKMLAPTVMLGIRRRRGLCWSPNTDVFVVAISKCNSQIVLLPSLKDPLRAMW